LVVNGSTRASVLGRFLTAASTTPTAQERQGGASGAWIGEMSLLERVWLKEQGKNTVQRKVTPRGTDEDANGKHGSESSKEKQEPDTSSQLKASRSMYTIVAQDDCIVLRWSHADMQSLMEKSTDMRAALTRAMTAAVVGKGL